VAADTGGRRTRAVVLAVVAAVLVLAVAAVAVLALTDRLPDGLVADATPTPSPTAPLDPPHAPAPDVLPPEPTESGPPPAVPTAALDAVLAAPSLGGAVGATVVDVASRQVLYDRDAAGPRTPASVVKLATMAAAIVAYGPEHRFATSVVRGGPAQLVLVGGGDATLTTRRSRPAELPQRASLVDLADQVVAALGPQTVPVHLAVDDSLFTGPAVSADWPASYVGSGIVSPVTALAVDAGRVRPGSDLRQPDPALAAGRALASLLTRRGVDVAPGVTRATAPVGAPSLATAQSPTVAELAELALQTSDNDLAEALLRLVAVHAGQPATFAGGAAAVLDELASIGVPTGGMVLLDGSGLARGSAVPPATLADLLVRAADDRATGLSALVDGLPVAGFSGTLALRFTTGAPRAVAGVVHAKTGTLTGVSALAGTTTVAGRPTVFVVMADRVPDGATLQARDELDRFATVLTEGVATPGPSKTPSSSGG
jgi:D-alanyl-D-alanine carboxypeptidase/D-alanyl-D-alanine-endopeptidase (penicillin-binding protein 4)